MEKFNEYILPFLKGEDIIYNSDGLSKSMSAEYFRNNFHKIAATELPNIGHRSFYYQHRTDPGFVMRFRISQYTGISATLMAYSEYEKQIKALEKL